jgi:signal transduction histidine kinase
LAGVRRRQGRHHRVPSRDRRLGEFSSDPFFEVFSSSVYVAIPLRLRGVVNAVLVADNADADRPIAVEDISLIYSMSQQAVTAMDRLYEAADNARKFRVLRKLQDALAAVEDPKRFADAVSAMLSMTARAIGATGALLKDPVRKKLTHVKTVDEVDATDRETDISITDSFDDILDRAAGSMKPVRGDETHPLLNEASARVVRHFLALPLLAGGECLGATAVYVEGFAAAGREGNEFSARDRLFFELCAGMLAERLDSLYKAEQVRRTQRLFDEVQSNWLRERASTRSGQRAEEHHDAVVSRLRDVTRALTGKESLGLRVASARELLESIESEATAFREELAAERDSLELVDLFALVKAVVEEWAPPVRAAGVDVKLRVPERGPVLLMNRESVSTALVNILRILAAHVSKGDRAMIECSASADKAVILVADTAGTVDGSLLSRLFMPFTSPSVDTDPQAAMSVAGDIIQRHGGEITVRSSSSWKTILAISFPAASNTDRRARRDRRGRPGDRRRSS